MDQKNGKSEFAVQLNSAKSGHLVFLSDTAGVTILTDPSIQELARGSFEQGLPRVRVEDDVVTNQGRKLLLLSHPAPSQGPSGEIRLNPSVPWEIEFRGHISNLHAELSELKLQSLDLLGGASQVRLWVSKPLGTAYIYIPGGIEHSAIHVPSRVGIRVQVNGLVKHLFFDGRHSDATGGKARLENADFQRLDGRYDICISGGASNLSIDE